MINLFGFLLISVFAAASFAQSSPESIRESVRKLTEQREFAQAAEEFGKLVAADPTNAELYLERSQLYKSADAMDKYLSDIDEAIKLRPDDETLISSVLSSLNKSARPETCSHGLKIIDRFIAAHSQNASAYHQRFLLQRCLGDHLAAYNDVSRAVALAPNIALYQSNRANLISYLGGSDQAIKLLGEIITSLESDLSAGLKDRNMISSLKRDLAATYFQLSMAHERTGNKEMAIAALTRAIDFSPDANIPHRARAYRRFGMYAEAISDFTAAIEESDKVDLRIKAQLPNRMMNYIWILERGDTYLLAQRFDEAIADFQECKRRNPDNKATFEARIATAKQKRAEKP